MMHESLERITDMARQRHYTDEELTLIARAATRMSLGCDVVEALQPSENELVQRAIKASQAAIPLPDHEFGGAEAMLTDMLAMILRQAALAMATDDGSRYYEFLASLRPLFFEAKLPPQFVEFALETLRTDCMARLSAPQGRLFDRWLKVATRYCTACSAVALQSDRIINDATTDLLRSFPDLEKRLADGKRRMQDDARNILKAATLSMLPDASQRIPQSLKSFHDANLRSNYGTSEMLEFVDAITTASRKHLTGGATFEYFLELKRLGHFLLISSDLVSKQATILDAAFEVAARRYPDAGRGDQEFRATIRKEGAHFLKCAAIASHRHGQEMMVEAFAEVFRDMVKAKHPSRFIIDYYQSILEKSREQLSAGSLATLDPVLHRLTHFMAMTADIAEKQNAMLERVAAELFDRYPEYYRRHPSSKTYVTRDQEQLLYNTALSMVPGSHILTVGRFSVFGEYLAHARFNEKMMHESFDLLEKALFKSFTGQSLARMIPRFREYKAYLELCSTLAFKEKEIIKEVSEMIKAKYGPQIARYEQGDGKVERDLVTMLHTVAISMVPDGYTALVRGLENFHDNILEVKMDKGMLEATYKALVKAVSSKLTSPHKDAYVAQLQKAADFLRASADIAEHQDEVIKTAVEATFAKHPDQMARYPSAKRRCAEDFELVIRRSLLAEIPGGDQQLSDGMWDFVQSIFTSRYSHTFIRDAYGELRKAFAKRVDRSTNNTVGATMDKLLAVIDIAEEVAGAETTLLDEVLQTLSQKYDAMLSGPRVREKIRHDMGMVLRHVVLLGVPGSDPRFFDLSRTLFIVTAKAKFGAAFIQDAYTALINAVNNQLSRGTRKTLSKPIEQLRDVLVLGSGIGEAEEIILKESLDKLFEKRGSVMNQYEHSREHTAHDQRMILRSSILSMVPGGEKEHEEMLRLMAVVSERGHFDKGTLREAYNILAESASANLKAGPVRQLAATIQKSTAVFA